MRPSRVGQIVKKSRSVRHPFADHRTPRMIKDSEDLPGEPSRRMRAGASRQPASTMRIAAEAAPKKSRGPVVERGPSLGFAVAVAGRTGTVESLAGLERGDAVIEAHGERGENRGERVVEPAEDAVRRYGAGRSADLAEEALELDLGDLPQRFAPTDESEFVVVSRGGFAVWTVRRTSPVDRCLLPILDFDPRLDEDPWCTTSNSIVRPRREGSPPSKPFPSLVFEAAPRCRSPSGSLST